MYTNSIKEVLKMVTKAEALERVTIKVPDGVKEWYANEGIKLGLSMGQYMCFVLVSYMRQQENMEVMKTLSELSKDKELQGMNKEALEFMKSPDFKKWLRRV
jgi:hypothetical protein